MPIAEELSCIGVITLYILSIATFIVLQSILPQPTDTCSLCQWRLISLVAHSKHMPASHTQQVYREDIIISGKSRFLGGNLKEVTSSSKTYNSQIYSEVEVKGQSGFVGGNYEAKGS